MSDAAVDANGRRHKEETAATTTTLGRAPSPQFHLRKRPPNGNKRRAAFCSDMTEKALALAPNLCKVCKTSRKPCMGLVISYYLSRRCTPFKLCRRTPLRKLAQSIQGNLRIKAAKSHYS